MKHGKIKAIPAHDISEGTLLIYKSDLGQREKTPRNKFFLQIVTVKKDYQLKIFHHGNGDYFTIDAREVLHKLFVLVVDFSKKTCHKASCECWDNEKKDCKLFKDTCLQLPLSYNQWEQVINNNQVDADIEIPFDIKLLVGRDVEHSGIEFNINEYIPTNILEKNCEKVAKIVAKIITSPHEKTVTISGAVTKDHLLTILEQNNYSLSCIIPFLSPTKDKPLLTILNDQQKRNNDILKQLK